jgi:hypothetical protein
MTDEVDLNLLFTLHVLDNQLGNMDNTVKRRRLFERLDLLNNKDAKLVTTATSRASPVLAAVVVVLGDRLRVLNKIRYASLFRMDRLVFWSCS